MALKIRLYPDLSSALYHYNGTEKLFFSKKNWLYLWEQPDGSLKPIDGPTNVLKIIDKSAALIGWSTRLFFERAVELLQEYRRGSFVEVEYDDLVAILLKAKDEHKNVLERAGATGHDAHSFVESLIVAEDENRRLEILAKFPEDERATNAAVACLSFFADHNLRYNSAEQRVFSRELEVAGTMDGDVLMDSCEDPECACQDFAPFKDKRMVLDLKTSNRLQASYLGQVHFYWHAKQAEFSDVKFDGAVILRLGKDDQSEFEPLFSMGEAEHEKGLQFFKNALALKRSVVEAEASMRAALDIRRAKRAAAKEAALRLCCPKAKVYKGSRKSKCFDDGTQCTACRTIYLDANGTKVL